MCIYFIERQVFMILSYVQLIVSIPKPSPIAWFFYMK